MLLALDTATRVISLALHDGHGLLAEWSWRSANHHTVELTPSVAEVLERTGVNVTDLTAVAVSKGPGSFTGLRIGMGFAKGLALARGLKFVAIPALDVVAAAQSYFRGTLMAVLEAGRGKLCVGTYRWRGGRWIASGEPMIMTWPQLLERIERPTLICGEIPHDQIEAHPPGKQPVALAPSAIGLRRAGYLAELAWERLRAGLDDDPVTVTPVYLHQPGVPGK